MATEEIDDAPSGLGLLFWCSVAFAPFIGILSCGITWNPAPNTTYYGFPFPGAVSVELENGMSDSGSSGGLALIVNPLVFLVATLLIWTVLFSARRLVRFVRSP